MLQFGVCISLPHAREALEAGFDYVELPAQLFKGQDTQADLAPIKDLAIPVTNMFFPGTMKLYSAEGRTQVPEYTRRVLDRAAAVGVKTMVIGSGAARHAPEGLNLDHAESEFASICGEIQKLARKYHITIAPENLNHIETNVGNDLAELVKRLEKVHVHYTADAFHLLMEWDDEGREHGRKTPSEAFWKHQLPTLPAHVHVATLPDRVYPKSDDALLQGFVKRLKTLGYKGRVSLECKFTDQANELAPALREIRDLFHAED